jgi:cation diffusion facilitator CzcD-associated flavoprotein CzcO
MRWLPPGPERTPARVAVIGAGFSGIAAAIALQRRGITDFTIFESSDGVGGTWRHNRYPGAEVDLESHIYSFSYAPADWSRTHARQDELQRYLEGVADRFSLRPHLRLNEKVESVTWDEVRSEYKLVTSSGTPHGPFRAVISAVGFLSVPRIPSLTREGAGFGRVMCHTAEWPDGLDLAGQRVGVLGTGSSAVQVVAAAASCAAEVKVFQREPNWLLPKGGRDFTPAERRMNAHPLVHRWRRLNLYLRYDLRQIRMSRGAVPERIAGRPARAQAAAHAGVPLRGEADCAERRLLLCAAAAPRQARPARR